MKKEKLTKDISIEWLNDVEHLVISEEIEGEYKQSISLSTDALKKLGDFLRRALHESAIEKQKQRLDTTRRIIRLGEK